MGMLLPSASRMPPSIETTANSTLSSGSRIGEAVTRAAAAAGVTTRVRTSRAPTICTDRATVRPRSSMKTKESVRTGTPRASATSGSALAKVSGRQMSARATRTNAEVLSSQVISGVSTATICPVRRPNLLAARPL